MKSFFAFFSLYLLLMFSGKISARKDVGEYWRVVTKDQPMPESIRGLIPKEEMPLINNFRPKPNILSLQSLAKDFEPEPNPLIYSAYRTKPVKEKSSVKDFEPELNPLIYSAYRTKPVKEKSTIKDFEAEPNPLIYSAYSTKPAEEKSSRSDFESEPDSLIAYGTKVAEEKSSSKDFESEPDSLIAYGTKVAEEKSSSKDFEPEPNPLTYSAYGTKPEKPLDDLSNKVSRLASQEVIDDHQRVSAKQRGQDTHRDSEHNMNHPADAISIMGHIKDPSKLKVFFTLKDLRVKNRMATYFSKADTSGSPPFLPKEEADTIPFSSKIIPYLLEYFSISPGSPQAKAIRETLSQCEAKPIKGETKLCATSLESMLDFTQSFFGPDSNYKVLTTKRLVKSRIIAQNYTITAKPKEINPPRMIACHREPYPYAVFYCHGLGGRNKLFQVPLRGDNGDMVDALSVCHMDTSQWSPDHASFRVLGFKPGESHVCHFFPSDHLAMVPI